MASHRMLYAGKLDGRKSETVTGFFIITAKNITGTLIGI